MNRRNTVSVTPAIGASTVAGRTTTAPSRTSAGTRASAGMACSTGLSQCFFTVKPLRGIAADLDSHFDVRTALGQQLGFNRLELERIDAKALGGENQFSCG